MMSGTAGGARVGREGWGWASGESEGSRQSGLCQKAYEVCVVWGRPLSVSELPTVRLLTDTALTLRTAGAVSASSSLFSLKTS